MRFRLNHLRPLIYFIPLAFLLVSCSKAQTLVKILGTWEMVNVTDVGSEIGEDWVFDVDDIMEIHQYYKTNPDTLISRWQGRYQVNIDVYKKYVDIYGFSGGMDYMNTDWEIVKSNNDVLILVNDRENGLLIKEFVKKHF